MSATASGTPFMSGIADNTVVRAHFQATGGALSALSLAEARSRTTKPQRRPEETACPELQSHAG